MGMKSSRGSGERQGAWGHKVLCTPGVGFMVCGGGESFSFMRTQFVHFKPGETGLLVCQCDEQIRYHERTALCNVRMW